MVFSSKLEGPVDEAKKLLEQLMFLYVPWEVVPGSRQAGGRTVLQGLGRNRRRAD